MADDYENWPVNVSSGNKPALRPTLKKADDTLTNFNGISKDALVGIFLDFDNRNYPLSLSDTDIKDKVTAAQKAKLKEEVNRQKEIAKLNKKLKEEEQKAEREKQRSANAAARSELEQKKETTTVRPAKTKASAQEDEATPIDGEAANRDQDGDVRMAGDENAAEAVPLVDPTAEAVSSPVDGERKRKRSATVSPSGTKRARTDRPKTSLIVKLKLRIQDGVATGGMQTATQVSETDCDKIMALANDNAQGLGARKRPRQTAEDTRTANTRRTLKKPGSRLQHGVASPLELANPMEGSKNNPGDTGAQGVGDVSGIATPANDPDHIPFRRHPPRTNRNLAKAPAVDEAVASDDGSDEYEQSSEEAAVSKALSVEDDEGPDADGLAKKTHVPAGILPLDKWVDEDDYSHSPYDEVAARTIVAAKSGNLGSSRDPNLVKEFKGTHKVDGYMHIPPLWLAKKMNRDQLGAGERELYDVQKEEWERQDAIMAGVSPPKKTARPKRKTWHDE
ncbi:uncharacterized protein J4E84_006917 [Alternaria hordeiaustralica]|uniref:uncharacterized protein n=1 Tax=Alternaria hordeiaustralica TaxID=1187925 RepID=UPI0020C428D1|nr:uncharacterized protein J4E84_006917 [Alternaria hordeiaustralica]KAI4683015.1 hypothetical protein J4E84_006917 [Alternaria hordeiaustralica]